jgi:2-oxoglutarate dehydrogenase E2 component (dihydrolipoamide succinyltransferase)
VRKESETMSEPEQIKIPEVGESITEGILVEWLKGDGDQVAMDEELLVVETDKITVTVNATVAGKLSIGVAEGETVEVGQAVGTIDTSAAAEPAEAERSEAERSEAERPGAGQAGGEPAETPSPEATGSETAGSGAEAPPMTTPAGMPQVREKLGPLEGLSPAVQRMVIEHHLDPAEIEGTGKDGRLTKQDVLRHLETRDSPRGGNGAADEARAAAGETPRSKEATGGDGSRSQARTTQAKTTPESAPGTEAGSGAGEERQEERQTRRKMSMLRQRIAERLVGAQQSTAMLTTFNECDLSRVIELRKRYRSDFKDRHETDLGFMSFFVKATVDALKEVPQVNAFIEGDEVVTNHYYDIGVAISTDKGLVVPVIRDADKLSMAGVEREILHLAQRARDRKLELADLVGGVFTISNGGVFGSMMSTPILNPPQSAILGMHAIKKRPVVVDDEIVIRPMMYLAVSYDHRLVDGAEAVTFLKRIVDCIESPERMLLEV